MTDVLRWDVPGRVNLIGDHLDYNGGPVLPLAIDRTLTVKARARDDRAVNVWSDLPASARASFTTDVRPGDVSDWAGYAAGAVWALAEAGHELGGADLVIESGLPAGAGLSSSAAVTCGIVAALGDVFDLGLDRADVARLARRAETDFVGVPVGGMDQIAVMHGVEGHGLLVETAAVDRDPTAITPVPLGWDHDGLALLVVNTRAHHRLADGEYAARRDECARAATELGLDALSDAGLDATFTLTDETLKARTRHVLTETARVRAAVSALNRRAWPQLGAILTASHASLRDDFQVSCPELDVAVEAALEAGALGARMTGGGFGGSAVALVPVDSVIAVRERLEARYAAHRWPKPDAFVVRASDGARRVR